MVELSTDNGTEVSRAIIPPDILTMKDAMLIIVSLTKIRDIVQVDDAEYQNLDIAMGDESNVFQIKFQLPQVPTMLVPEAVESIQSPNILINNEIVFVEQIELALNKLNEEERSVELLTMVPTLAQNTPEEIAERILLTKETSGRVEALRDSVESYREHIEKSIQIAYAKMDIFVVGTVLEAKQDCMNNYRKGDLVEITAIEGDEVVIDDAGRIHKDYVVLYFKKHEGGI